VTQGVGSDEDALAASLAEPARFAVLFERHVDLIHRYLSFRVGPDIAEDLTAETFARAFAGRRRYQVARAIRMGSPSLGRRPCSSPRVPGFSAEGRHGLPLAL
jgi:hypothetical protein